MKENFGEVISAYTRAQAIEDGVLVDVSDIAKQASFVHPVAVTSSVWSKYIKWSDEDNNKQCYQDWDGRLWDILWMLRWNINKKVEGDRILFELNIVPRDGHSQQARPTKLKAICHGGDNAEPVITIMMSDED